MKAKIESTSELERWQAVVERNSQFDGYFVYAVVTTGIYCRPMCSSRLPNRENVRFFNSWQLAEEAGFRPCKRCTPKTKNAPDYAVDAVLKACKMIEEADKEPTLNQLANAVGLSPHYFHRLFKKTVGITPKQYATEKRLERVRRSLQKESTVTEAIYDAGYGSGSRFYEKAVPSLGMKPSEYQKGGAGLTILYSIIQSYLGWVLVAFTDRGICRIDIDDVPENLKSRLEDNFPMAIFLDDDPEIGKLVAQTLAFLEAPEQGLALPLHVRGTAFQHRVWSALRNIPAGKTASYGEIAEQIGNPNAARAVAGACASNPIVVAIPCHRVIKSNGELGGYRLGVERKRTLLERESRKSVG
jgi:AraC family transcriptional regulator of adaptative response/methylated-DNA-[protein]-cysteine methyltransferase